MYHFVHLCLRLGLDAAPCACACDDELSVLICCCVARVFVLHSTRPRPRVI
jgi:hypothetical protein